MNTYYTCYSSLESGDITFLDNYPSLNEAQKRLKSVIKNHMVDEKPNVCFKIFDKKDFNIETIMNDEEFPEGIVYRVKSMGADVHEKKINYEPTTVVGYLKPVTVVKQVAKVSIKELYVGNSSTGATLRAPVAQPTKQSVNFMSELGDILKAGVRLKSVKQRHLKPCKVQIPDDVASFINNY